MATVSSHGTLGRDGYRIERLTLRTAPDILVPALVFVPAGGPELKPAVLYVHGEGKATDAGPGGDIQSLVRSGRVVMAVDPRGIGESAPTSAAGGYRPLWQMLQRALLVDRTLVGLQAEDLLAAFDALASRDDVDPERVALVGRGTGGVLALVVGVLEPRVQKVAVEGTVLSYLEIARAPLHEDLTGIFVPGVLRDFDLPDLAAAVAPKQVWLVDPRTPTGALVSVDRATEVYGAANEPHLRVIHRPQDWPFEAVYGEWLAEGP